MSAPTAPSPAAAPISAAGLADVIAVHTRLSRVDGEAGQLVLAGHRVEDLAFHHGFEAVCHLLWHGALPDNATLEALRHDLGVRRLGIHRRMEDTGGPALPRPLPAGPKSNANPTVKSHPMDALRAILAGFASTGDPFDDARTMTAAIPVANAWWWATRQGARPLEPRTDLGTAADYLRLITGEEPSPASVRGMERYLVTVSDHGMNASTFTARVIASTRSDLVSAVVGAVGALKGPLHGGAPGPVLDMLDAIGAPDRAAGWLRAEVDAGRRIMGMGHRVYRVRDPRAAVFERAVADLESGGAAGGRLRLARAIEEEAEALLAERHPGRRLKANVEFYTAVLLEALGLPRELFSATFAAGRVAGWAGHVIEQRAEDRLIRPRSAYVGPEPA